MSSPGVPPDNPLRIELTGTDPIVSWLLPDILPRGVVAVLAGLPGTGKSYLSYSLGLALAGGLPMLGQQPGQPCRVLYFDQENSAPDRIQYERWAWHGLGCPNLDQLCDHFWCAPFVLGGRDWPAQATHHIQLHQPDLIIIDTTTPACAITDENDNGEAARAVGWLRHLQTLTPQPPTVFALKHAKVRADDGSYTLRGAKAWEGAVDSIIYASRHKGRPRADGLSRVTLHPGKVRAFGLRATLTIDPSRTEDGRGIRLGLARD